MRRLWLWLALIAVAAGTGFAFFVSVRDPATTAFTLGVDVHEGLMPITQDGSTLDLEYCSNASPFEGSTAVKTVVIAIHGSLRDGCDYASYATASADAAGELSSTLVVAPIFATYDDLSNGDDHTLYWDDEGWKSGNQSLSDEADRPWTTSSFAALDQLVQQVADRTQFPNLDHVVIAGHSAGGQFVNRYSFGSPDPSGGVPVRYVVMNPSSYMYLTPKRVVDGDLRHLTADEKSGCPGYNDYKYGLHDLNSYMSAAPSNFIDRFTGRDVEYLLGEDDTDPEDSSIDTSCEGEWQGSQRFERGNNYWESLLSVIGTTIKEHQTVVTVPGVAHDGELMFESPRGQAALFTPTGSQ
jgi:hypothetical protein